MAPATEESEEDLPVRMHFMHQQTTTVRRHSACCGTSVDITHTHPRPLNSSDTSWLNKVWKKYRPHYTMPSAKGTDFTVCKICIRLNDKIFTGVSAKDRSFWKGALLAHYELQEALRYVVLEMLVCCVLISLSDFYHKWCEHARLNPDEVLTIIIDKLDSFKTRVPRFANAALDSDAK
jgi:hypothetical protein